MHIGRFQDHLVLRCGALPDSAAYRRRTRHRQQIASAHRFSPLGCGAV
jgi:hypothetical protein